MSPDKEHLHHKLLSLGLGTRTVLLIIYAVELALSCLVVARFSMPYQYFFSLTVLAWCFVDCGFVWLHYVTSPRARWEEFAKRREVELAKADQEEDEIERTGTWFGQRK